MAEPNKDIVTCCPELMNRFRNTPSYMQSLEARVNALEVLMTEIIEAVLPKQEQEES